MPDKYLKVFFFFNCLESVIHSGELKDVAQRVGMQWSKWASTYALPRLNVSLKWKKKFYNTEDHHALWIRILGLQNIQRCSAKKENVTRG